MVWDFRNRLVPSNWARRGIAFPCAHLVCGQVQTMKPRTVKPSTRKSSANNRAEMKSADPRVRKVVRAIQRDEFDSLPELARLVKLSGSRLSHLFKEETGLSLGELLVKQRLDKAAHLLRSTKMTIGEISQRV